MQKSSSTTKTKLESFKKFDVFPKVVDVDFYSRSFSGGVITVATYVLAGFLLFAQVGYFLKTHVKHDLTVDLGRGERMRITLDIFFPNLSCQSIGLDVMDVSGETHLDVEHDMFKIRYDRYGEKISKANPERMSANEKAPPALPAPKAAEELVPKFEADGKTKYCGSCYGANNGNSTRCCQTCEEVRQAYIEVGWAFTGAMTMEQCKREGYSDVLRNIHDEGCEFKGYIDVNKVQGNFHIAPGKSFHQGDQHVHDLSPFPDGKFNFTHTVKHLSFGGDYPGKIDALDETWRILDPPSETGVYQYFFRIVPTAYKYLSPFKKDISTNQYSVVDHFKALNPKNNKLGVDLPGVFFFYDLSPIKVEISEYRISFMRFLAETCASVGGVFAVSGIIDKVVYKGGLVIRKKIELGKQR